MHNKKKRKLVIRELICSGYNLETIAEKIGVSVSTVSRTIKQFREENKQWLVDVAQKDYPSIYRESLEGLRLDLVHLNELFANDSVQKNIKLQLQIRREITNVRSKYFEYLLQGPLVWSLKALVDKCNPEPIGLPVMESLGGISVVN